MQVHYFQEYVAYEIKAQNEMVFDIDHQSLKEGAHAQIHPSNNGLNQRFTLHKQEGDTYVLRCAHSQQVLDGSNEHIQQKFENGTAEQQFRFLAHGGAFAIQNKHTGHYLGVAELEHSAKVIQGNFTGGPNQLFTLKGYIL